MKIKKKTAFGDKKKLFHQGNAKAYTWVVAVKKIHELGYASLSEFKSYSLFNVFNLEK